jgi:hypothetical protein
MPPSVVSVLVLFDSKGFAICVDIPIMVIIILLFTILFYVMAWFLQYLEDRKMQVGDRAYLPTVEAIRRNDQSTVRDLLSLLIRYHSTSRYPVPREHNRSLHADAL